MGTSPVVHIHRGLDLRLAGAPRSDVVDLRPSGLACVHPPDFRGIKPRLLVREGDVVKRGTPLFHDRKRETLRGVSPAGGRVRSITIGPRRVIERIAIEIADREDAESFPRYGADGVLNLARGQILELFESTGTLVYLRQRPFSGMADPDARPKSIFVNGMATAPFQADPQTCLRGHETAFQAGLNAMTRLTEGRVFLCLAPGAHASSPALASAKGAETVLFDGPHPAGNTSVHIHHVDPIRPGDVVWTIHAADLVLVGRLLTEGRVPESRVVALGGPGVREPARSHYRVRIGEAIDHLLEGRIEEGEQRLVRGDVLGGIQAAAGESLHALDRAVNVLPEDRERRLLGWIMPGLDQYSRSRTFLSRWLRPTARWNLGTGTHGSRRAMVITGMYDRYLPMKIMTDFLVRAVLAHDVEESVKLGILEVDPEDFALPAFVCPSKMDLVGIMRRGLDEVEREGVTA